MSLRRTVEEVRRAMSEAPRRFGVVDSLHGTMTSVAPESRFPVSVVLALGGGLAVAYGLNGILKNLFLANTLLWFGASLFAFALGCGLLWLASLASAWWRLGYAAASLLVIFSAAVRLRATGAVIAKFQARGFGDERWAFVVTQTDRMTILLLVLSLVVVLLAGGASSLASLVSSAYKAQRR